MELLILKDGQVFARARDEAGEGAEYTLMSVADGDIPDYPKTPAGTGKYYELSLTGSALSWELKDRPLTEMEEIRQALDLLLSGNTEV